MSRAIVMTSGKGGVGKTTLTVTVGRELAAMSQRVVLIDADFGLNNLDVVTGLENHVVYDIVDIAENRCRIRQALISDREVQNLHILPCCHSYDRSALDGQSLRAIVAALKTAYDYIFIDSPAGIERGFHRAVSAADEAIVVTTPHMSALRDAEKVLSLLKPYSLSRTAVVLNRVRGDTEITGDTVTAAEVASFLSSEVIGVIPDDDKINELSTLSRPLDGKSEGVTAIKMLCKRLHTGCGELYDATRRYRGVLGAVMRSIKRFV